MSSVNSTLFAQDAHANKGEHISCFEQQSSLPQQGIKLLQAIRMINMNDAHFFKVQI